MTFHQNVPVKTGTVPPCAQPNQQQDKNQQKQKSYRKNLHFFASFLLIIFLGFSTNTATAQLDLRFNTYTLKSGTDRQEGATYLYKNVATGVDCIVGIVKIGGGASLFSFDDNSGAYGGTGNRFQPIISAPNNDYNTNYVRFRFQLIVSNTYSNGSGTAYVPTQAVWFRSYDVDGNGVANGLKEFVELGSAFTGSWVDDPSQLLSATPVVTGDKAYMISDATINGNDISDEGQYAFNGFIKSNSTSTWDIIGGSYVGRYTPNTSSSFGDDDRLNSWSFVNNECDPSVDFGDAPYSYNGTGVPGFHMVPSLSNCRRLYLGSVKPDYDSDPSGNIGANLDDLNSTLDDEDCYTSQYFPQYDGSGTYKVSVRVTNVGYSTAYLYGYIDFNGDGDFLDAGERSNKVTVATSASTQTVDVKWTSVTGYSITNVNRYVRFRVAYNASEIDGPNDAAYSGEMEDYRFDIQRDISGTVHWDKDGLTDGAIDGPGIGNPNGASLYAILVNADGKVLESVTVDANNGKYTLTKAGTNCTYTVLISTTPGTVGSTPPAAIVPSCWAFTGDGYGTGDGTPNGSISGTLDNVGSDITGIDFGIEQAPVAANKSLTGNGNPGGTNNYTIPAGSFAATDPDGSIIYVNIPTFPTNVTSVTIGSTKYTSSNWPANGVDSIPFNSGNPTVLVDPIDGNVTAAITYTAYDNARVKSCSSGVLSIEFKVIAISGKIWDDANGDAVVQTTEAVYNGTASAVYVYLVDANNKIIQSTTASSTGTYTFSNAPYNTANYKVVMSTTYTALGNTVPAVALPANYITTGETQGVNKEGTPDGKIAIPAITTAITDYNFGMEQLPESMDRTITLTSVVTNTLYALNGIPMKGSDPEDSPAAGSISNGGTFKITTLPLLGAVLYYNGVAITTANYVITNYDPTKLSVKYTLAPIPTGVFFNYATMDAAGKFDPTPAKYTISIASVLPLNGLDLSANLQGSSVKLNWNVTGERNVVRYELVYSYNSNTVFTPLTTVAYCASNSENNTYSYIHVPGVSSGAIYYRVIQYHADGTSSTSNQVSVKLNDKNGAFVTVMPTLITDMANIRIRTLTEGKTVINIVDNNGKLVMKKELSLTPGTTTFTLDGWQALANGTYYVQVNNTDAQTSTKVVVQH